MIVYDFNPKASKPKRRPKRPKVTLPTVRLSRRTWLVAACLLLAVVVGFGVYAAVGRGDTGSDAGKEAVPTGFERIAPASVYISSDDARKRRTIAVTALTPESWRAQLTRSGIAQLDSNDFMVLAMRFTPPGVDQGGAADTVDSTLVMENVGGWAGKDDATGKKVKAADKQKYLAYLQGLRKAQKVSAADLGPYQTILGGALANPEYVHTADGRFTGVAGILGNGASSQFVARLSTVVQGQVLYLVMNVALPGDAAGQAEAKQQAIAIIQSLAMNTTSITATNPAVTQ